MSETTLNPELDVATPRVYTWSALNAEHRPDEKRLMGQHCAMHNFLVPRGSNPEKDPREKLASVLVNGGTSPTMAVEQCLEWIVANQDRGPFDVTWYTTSALVPASLRDYREKYKHLAAAMHLFLFPGRVDQQMEAVSGPDAEAFAQNLDRCFRYAFLSAHSFDMSTGTAYFHLPEEVRLQKACATRYAAHKFLFLDSGKFKKEGETGYRIDELLGTADVVTIYTVASEHENRNRSLRQQFMALCDRLLATASPAPNAEHTVVGARSLEFVLVGRGTVATEYAKVDGILRTLP